MSVWRILGIQQTNDKSTIKKAYAEKVKLCRPEDDPEGFQALHQAYKQALFEIRQAQAQAQEAQWQQQQTDAGNAQNKGIDDAEVQHNDVSEPLKQQAEAPEAQENVTQEPTADGGEQHSELTAEQAEYLEAQENEYKALVEKVEVVLADDNKRNKPTHWEFIAQSDFILDNHFNSQLGMFVLDQVLKLNNQNSKLSKRQKRYSGSNATVTRNVMVYLNSIFYWKGQVNAMRYYFGDENTLKVLKLIGDNDLNSRQNTALDSVKGGIVHESQKKAVDDFHLYQESVNALKNLRNITAFSHVLFGIFCLVLVNESLENDNLQGILVSLFFLVLFIGQFIGVMLRNRIVIMTVWPIAICWLFAFPWGTYLGYKMINALVPAQRFFKYED